MNDNLHFTEQCNPTLKAQAEMILPALNAFLYAWVVVDAQARIVGVNDDYLALIGKDFDTIANKPIGKIVAQTHLPDVVGLGKPQYLYRITFGNKPCVASSTPLRDEEADTVIGAPLESWSSRTLTYGGCDPYSMASRSSRAKRRLSGVLA